MGSRSPGLWVVLARSPSQVFPSGLMTAQIPITVARQHGILTRFPIIPKAKKPWGTAHVAKYTSKGRRLLREQANKLAAFETQPKCWPYHFVGNPTNYKKRPPNLVGGQVFCGGMYET